MWWIFLYFKLIDFPIFNVADCYVVISTLLLILLFFFVYSDEELEFLFIRKTEEKNRRMENNRKRRMQFETEYIVRKKFPACELTNFLLESCPDYSQAFLFQKLLKSELVEVNGKPVAATKKAAGDTVTFRGAGSWKRRLRRRR